MSHDEVEIRDRVRRNETRLTVLANALGVDVQGSAPSWNSDLESIQVPTPNCSLRSILSAVPPRFHGQHVPVRIGSEYLATVFCEVAPFRSTAYKARNAAC
jgi:hypothetical protein